MIYMGSKNRIAKYIIPMIQKVIDITGANYYIEPFVGGANIIDKIDCNYKVGYDLNPFLIALLNYVKSGGILPNDINREDYCVARELFHSYEAGSIELSKEDFIRLGYIGFLASYNGRFFDGGYAKSSDSRNYYQGAKRNIEKQAENLKSIEFYVSDYREIFDNFPLNAVIYCDPPYENTKGYNAKKFNHDEFWDVMRDWSKNTYVFISELNAPSDFRCIWEKPIKHCINAKQKKQVVEKLFVYKDGKLGDMKF